MSTTHYSPSRSATDTEAYVRGANDDRGVVVTCDVPGPPGSFAAQARTLREAHHRAVECLHYRQSFAEDEIDPRNPEDLQRCNDLGYLLAKKMHPDSDALVVTHVDGRGGKPHNHILVINHDNETGLALSNYRTFKDRPEKGQQNGVQSANDELMREHGLSVVNGPRQVATDWEIRREDFAEDSLDRQMGDRMAAALSDPRAVDKQGLTAVIGEQNAVVGEDGVLLPRLRLHTSVSKKGKRHGQETWTVYIQDRRGEGTRAERRKRASALCFDFTPEGAQPYFDYHAEQKILKEQNDERRARAAEAARRAADHAQHTDLGDRRDPHLFGDCGGEPDGLDQGGDQQGRDADDAILELEHLRRRAVADLEHREAAERDRGDARGVLPSPRRTSAGQRRFPIGVGSEPDREDDGLEL